MTYNWKCFTCKVQKEIEASDEPACCAWFLENVVCGDKHVVDCPEYEDINKKEC